MRGNFHVRFLGGWGAAMLPGYPAEMRATSSPYPTVTHRIVAKACRARADDE